MYTQDDAVRHAVDRAAREGGCFTVYKEGEATYYVRAAEATRPSSKDWAVTTLCIAQRWDSETIQVRYAGARSDWVKV